MQIRVKMVPHVNDHAIRAVGSVIFGDEITVCELILREKKSGGMFISFPKRNTGKSDSKGNIIYENVAFPITKECRTALEEAAIESYEKGNTVYLTDKRPAQLMIEAIAFDHPYMNRVGKSQITIGDIFLIRNIYINKNSDGSLYVTYPNFKTSYTASDGKPIYREIVMMSTSLRKQINEVVISEYKKNVELKEQDSFSIKSRLDEAMKVIGAKTGQRTLKREEITL